MGDQLRFNQRWEFRRKENSFDSSSDDSKLNSSHEPFLKKHKLVTLLDNESSETCKFQTEENPGNPNKEDRTKFGNAKKRGPRRRKSAHEEDNRKKSRTTGACEPASLDGVKIFMDSLLDDLEASRENMLKWMTVEMQKPEAEDTSPQKETRTENNGRKKAQPRARRAKKISGSTQETVCEEKQTNHEEHIKEQPLSQNILDETENICVPGRSNVKFDVRSLDCNVGPLERFVQSSEAGYAKNYFQAQEERVGYGKVTEIVTPTEKERGKSLVSPSVCKCRHQPSSSTKQCVPVQQNEKGLVLGIRAQSCNLGTPERASKGNKASEPNTSTKPPENQSHHSGEAAGSVQLSTEKEKYENLEQPVRPKLFSSGPLLPVSSSMCSTFPSLITEPPTMAKHKPASFTSNHVPPRRGLQPLDSTDIQGYFPAEQTENITGSFTQLHSRNMNFFYQNNNYFSTFPAQLNHGMDSGFTRTHQVSLHNLQRENSNMLSLRMSGGAIRFSAESNGLAQQYSGTDLNNLSDYRADGRQMPYQIQNTSNDSFFPN